MRKALHIVGVVLCGAAFVFILGTAGSSDLNTISFEQVLVQVVIALVVGGIGCGIMKITEV